MMGSPFAIFLMILLPMMMSCNSGGSADKTPEATISDAIAAPAPANTFPDLSGRTNLTFPFSINNDNYYDQYDVFKGDSLTRGEFNAMRLDTLGDCSIEDGCNYYVLRDIAFSNDFNTWLIYRANGGSEWNMWLVNYTVDNQFIDCLHILYGDGVEYMDETFSYVTQDEIEVTYIVYDYSGETQKSTKEVSLYTFDQSGHFIKTNLLELSEN